MDARAPHGSLLAGDISSSAAVAADPHRPAAITVPRFRFVLGATYAPTARDTDRDGMPDKNNAVPPAGKRSGERSGCPADANEEKKP